MYTVQYLKIIGPLIQHFDQLVLVIVALSRISRTGKVVKTLAPLLVDDEECLIIIFSLLTKEFRNVLGQYTFQSPGSGPHIRSPSDTFFPEPYTSTPSLLTQKQYDLWHCFLEQLPSVLHRGKYLPFNSQFLDFSAYSF